SRENPPENQDLQALSASVIRLYCRMPRLDPPASGSFRKREFWITEYRHRNRCMEQTDQPELGI
ncbi:MAG: hypothetical protein JW793_13845, partial [Acidobacteria bacterium]|nr:hypothetical protein [Acidobacteriota bacterium]